ncbi:MAG: hypothetical protein Q9224_005718 [Gallowayella concinna]
MPVPTPLPEFSMRFTPERSVRLRAVDMFTNTLEAMIWYTTQNWEKSLPVTRQLFYLGGATSHLGVATTKAGVQCKHVIFALYDAGLEIARLDKYGLFGGMRLHNEFVGFLRYKDGLSPSLREGTGPKSSLVAASDTQPGISKPHSTGESSNPTVGLADVPLAGWVSDPQFPGFKLFYRCLDHRPTSDIDPGLIFTALVKAFTTAAQEGAKYGLESLRSAIYSTSVEGSMSISLYGEDMSWLQLIKALAILWRRILAGYMPRQGALLREVRFEIHFGDRKIGAGNVSKNRPRPIRGRDASTVDVKVS